VELEFNPLSLEAARPWCQNTPMSSTKPSALIILMPGVEEMEAVTPIDLLRRAGIDVTTASVGAEKFVTGRNNIPLGADVALSEIGERTFDVVILPGGPGVKHLRKAPEVLKLVKTQASAGRLLAAICAAPTVLNDAGLLEGREFTAHFSVESELPALIRDAPVAHDGNIITSRGAGTAIPFSLHLIETLRSLETANQVAESICLVK